MAGSCGAASVDRWTAWVWRLLCLLTAMSGLAAYTGVLWSLPPLWLGVALMPGLLVTLIFAVASYADWRSSRAGSSGR